MTPTLVSLVCVAVVCVAALCVVAYCFRCAVSFMQDEARAARDLYQSSAAQAHELALSTVRGSAEAVAEAVSSSTYGRAPVIAPDQVERELIEEAARDMVDPYLVDDTDPFDHAVAGDREDAAIIAAGDTAPWLNGRTGGA